MSETYVAGLAKPIRYIGRVAGIPPPPHRDLQTDDKSSIPDWKCTIVCGIPMIDASSPS